ncbi:MAG TPA: peptide chain release factor N(5)-glutamine methyltransferase [Candidatus Saccharimonadales bacterium]|nr:peptide chain release factor N(5)-glutamine methyltransferase [Candidatus Saccharimonadales bacterium]
MKIAEILENSTTEQQILLSFILKKDRSFLSAFPETNLTLQQLRSFKTLGNRLEKGEPLAYLLGYQEFYGRKFFVSKDVLIPRSDSEKLIDKVLKLTKNEKLTIVDVGTGSGCLGITLALEKPNLKIILTDIDPKALVVAKKNALLYHIEKRLKFVRSDLLESVNEPVDLIVANLPYIPTKNWEKLPTQIKDHEPKLALDSGERKTTFYERLFQQAKDKLAKPYRIVYEIDGDIFIKEV